MECRSAKRRQWIVANYDVLPVAHIQLLAGQTKHSDAGQTITNDYYIFETVSKISGKKDMILCGMGTAKDFLKLINHKGLPLFNPLHEVGEAGDYHVENLQVGMPAVRKREGLVWNPMAKQLYNAIMWIIILIDAKPDSTIFEIREKVYQYKDREPFGSRIRGVNTIIHKTLPNKTLTEAINELRRENNLRNDLCTFDLLIDAINNGTDKEGNFLNIQCYF